MTDEDHSVVTILTLISTLVGATLGLRFKVSILIPAIAVAFLLVIVTELARATGVGSIALAMVLVATFLQLGYLFGIATRFVIAASRASRIGRLSRSRQLLQAPPKAAQ